VIVRFVDIGEIVDHNIKLSFIIIFNSENSVKRLDKHHFLVICGLSESIKFSVIPGYPTTEKYCNNVVLYFTVFVTFD
jgi:hypothetical protein